VSEADDRLKVTNIVSKHLDSMFEELDKSGIDAEDILEFLLDEGDLEDRYFRWGHSGT
jgi:hypothetical protein